MLRTLLAGFGIGRWEFGEKFSQAESVQDPAVKVEFYTRMLEAWRVWDGSESKASVLYNRGLVYFEDLEQFDKALVDVDAAISLAPKRAGLRMTRGGILVKLNNFDAALLDLDRAAVLDPSNAGIFHNRAMAREGKGDFPGAMEDFNRAIALNPHLAMAYNGRGLLFKKLKQPEQALADYARAAAEEPKDEAAWVNRAILFLSDAKPAEAIADLEIALHLSPDNILALRNRAIAFLVKKDYPRAWRECGRLIELKPECWKSYVLRGEASLRMSRLDDAMADFDKALALEPASVLTLQRRAELYRRLEKPELEINDIERSIAASETALTLAFRGEALLLRGRTREAREDTLRASALDPQEAAAHAMLGRIAFETGEEAAAVAAFDAALKLDENCVTALIGSAILAAKSGRLDEARRFRLKALRLEPGLGGSVQKAREEGYYFTPAEAGLFAALAEARPEP